MSVIVPGRFGSPTKRARDHLSNQMAGLLAPYISELGWDTVSNDLLSIVGGLIATGSDKPAKDLETAAVFLRKYNWTRAKKMLFAARQGVNPEDVGEEFLKDAVPGHNQDGAAVPERDKPQEAPADEASTGSPVVEDPAVDGSRHD